MYDSGGIGVMCMADGVGVISMTVVGLIVMSMTLVNIDVMRMTVVGVCHVYDHGMHVGYKSQDTIPMVHGTQRQRYCLARYMS